MRSSFQTRFTSILLIAILFIIALSFSSPSSPSTSSSSSAFLVILGVDAAPATKTKTTASTSGSTTASTTKKPVASSTKSNVEKKPSKESANKPASGKRKQNEQQPITAREPVAEPVVTPESQPTTLSEVLALVQSVSVQLLEICTASAHTTSEFAQKQFAALTAAVQHATAVAASSETTQEKKNAAHAGSIDASKIPAASLAASGSPEQEWDHFSDEAIWTLLCVGLVTVIVRDLLIR